MGVLLTYFAPGGRTFLDRRLYLPQEWCADEQRRREARVPANVTFETKLELAVEMLEYAWAQGVPMAWVTGDEVYGDAAYAPTRSARRAGGACCASRLTLPSGESVRCWKNLRLAPWDGPERELVWRKGRPLQRRSRR